MALSKLNFRTPDGKRKIQMCEAREKIDPVMRELVDKIDDCYYGTPLETPITDPETGKPQRRAKDGWRHGVSKPFFIWDKEDTLEQSKLKFDLLSGIIHHLTAIFQHLFNCDEAEKYPEEKYNNIYDGDMQVIGTRVKRKKQQIKQLIIQYNAANLSPPLTRARINNIVNWIKSRPIVDELLKRRADLAPIADPDDETDVS